jgi:hypothetical protein
LEKAYAVFAFGFLSLYSVMLNSNSGLNLFALGCGFTNTILTFSVEIVFAPSWSVTLSFRLKLVSMFDFVTPLNVIY